MDEVTTLSLLDKQGWAFTHGYFYAEFTCRNACTGWVFPIERNTLEVRAAPPCMIRGVNVTSRGKWSISEGVAIFF